MDSQPAFPLWSPSSARAGTAGLRDTLLVLVALLLPAVAALMLLRRAAGALAVPAGAPLITAAALVAMSAAIAVHLAVRSRPLPRSLARAADLGADASLAAIAMSLSIPGTSVTALAILWLVVVAEIGWSSQTRDRTPGNIGSESRTRKLHARVAPAIDPSADQVETSPWNDPDCTQHLEYRTDDGCLTVSGWIRADFAAGQRTAIVHAAFCPAFEHTPRVDAEVLDGQYCRVRATLVLPWGVRWELKLDEAAEEPAATVLGFTATDAPSPNP